MKQQKLLSVIFLVKIIFFLGFFISLLFYFNDILKVKNIVLKEKIDIIGLEDLHNKNIFFINQKIVEENFLKKNPFLKAVKIEKKYPSTLVLNIEKETILAKIKINKGYFYLTKEGKILKKNQQDQGHYPLIIFYKKFYYHSYQTGDKIDFLEIKKTLFFIDEARQLLIFPYSIEILNQDMLVFNMAKNRILFSLKKDLNLQSYQLKEIVKNFKRQGLIFKELDLRFDKPIIRY